MDKQRPSDELDFAGEDLELDFAGEPLDLPGEDVSATAPPPPKPKARAPKLYSAEEPPPFEEDRYYTRRTVNGVDYLKHKENGVVTRADGGDVVIDPAILNAFGNMTPTKKAQKVFDAQQGEPEDADFVVDGGGEQPSALDEFWKSAKRTAVTGIGDALRGVSIMTTDDPVRVKEVEAGLAGLRAMKPAAAEKFWRGIPANMDINPVSAFNYQLAAQARLQGKDKEADEYLATARKYLDTRPLEQQQLYQQGQDISATVAGPEYNPAAEWADSWTVAIGQGLGSTAAYVPVGLASGGLGVAALGGAQTSAQQYDIGQQELADYKAGKAANSRLAGLSPEDQARQIMRQAKLGTLPGASEVLPIETLIEQTAKRIPGLRPLANSPVWNKLVKGAGRILTQATVEGGQEYGQQVAQNFITQLMLNPDQELTEDAWENALVGAVTGGIMQGGAEGVGAVMSRKKPPLPPTVSNTEEKTDLPDTTGQGRPPANEAPPADAMQALLDAGLAPGDIASMTPEQVADAIKTLKQQGAAPEGMAPPRNVPPAAPPPGTVPMAPRRPKARPDASAGQEAAFAPDQPSAEPIGDVKAQIEDLKSGSARQGVYLSKEAWDHAGPAIAGTEGVFKIENFDGKGGALLVADKNVGRKAVADRDAGVPLQQIIGALTGSGTGKPADGDAVVQQVDGQGNVTRESLVNAETQELTVADMAAAGKPVRVVTPEQAIARREEAVAADARPDFSGEAVDDARPRFTSADKSYIQQFGVDDLKTNAKVFQYKEGGDAEGVTGALKDVKVWEDANSGILTVWKDRGGQHFVANGHQRFGLARRAKAAGQSPVLTARVYREEDGWSASDVMIIAAQVNMGENTGTALDAAKIIRARPNAADNLPQNAVVRDGKGLAKLADDAFGMVVNGKVQPSYAALVGQMVPDRAKHTEVLGILAKADPDSVVEAESIVRDAMDAPAVQATMEDLFGTTESTQILYKERAQVLSAASTAIRKDRAAFKVLVKEEARIAQEGNKLVTERNAERADEDGKLLATLQATARRKGPVADALAVAAQKLHQGQSLKQSVEGFLASLRGTPEGAPERSPENPGRKRTEPQKTDVKAAPAPASGYGTRNKLVTADRAAELRAKLKAKLSGSQINSGIDPEVLAMGAELAAFHIEAGARRFADFAKAVAADLGMDVARLKPYLRSWYNGARDMLEDSGADVSGMDSAEAVKVELAKLLDPGEAKPRPIDAQDVASPGSAPFTALNTFVAKAPIGENAARYVVAEGKKRGAEVLLAIDGKGTVIGDGHGIKHTVGFSKRMSAALSDASADLLIHHNHPQSTSFSAADIAMLARPGLRVLYAHGHDGSYYRAEIPASLKKAVPDLAGRLARLHGVAEIILYKTLAREVTGGRMTEIAATAALRDAAIRAIAATGLLRYDTNVETPAFEGYDSAIKEAAEYARQQTENLGLDRNPKPVRHIGDMEAVFGRSQEPNAAQPGTDGTDQARPPRDADQGAGGVTDAPSSSGSLEPDRGEPDAGDDVGQENLFAPTSQDGSRTGARGTADQRRNQGRDGDGGIPQGDAAAVGARGDSSVPARSPQPQASDAAAGERERSDAGGRQGLPDERLTDEQTQNLARKEADLETRRAAQKAAESVAVIGQDAANIADTLPMLTREQQWDVLKAEQRYAAPNGHGHLFTNGTGTGKTYSGLGVVKRFAKQGRTNILIVAPSQGILMDWQKAARNFGLDLSILGSTQDAGKGIVLTTYANLGANRHLADRDWDLVVADEAHKLSSDKDGSPTSALATFRALTLHPDGLFDRARMALRDEWDAIDAKRKAKEDNWQDGYAAFRAKADELINRWRGQPRPKALLMSATPFAYHFSLDYAEGYLFEFDRAQKGERYNSGGGRERFYMENLGYRMRNNKLTKPDANVRSEIMERELHERLKREGSLSGRALEVEKDYDRKFILVNDAIGSKIDEALSFLFEADQGKFRVIHDAVMKRFDYLSRMRLLEAIKARHAVPYIKASIARGRKVVVFHDYNHGGGFSPFDLNFNPEQEITVTLGGKSVKIKPAQVYDEFLRRLPWVKDLKFSDYLPPIDEIKKNFPDALIYNGTVPVKKRDAAKREFNADGNGKDVIVVQSAAGEAGISLHDVTGKQQRVLLNLGMPIRPTTSLQQEGRIYRVGQATDALFRYMNTGTNWERWTFAGKIAERAGTAENLALGQQARTIRQSFIDAFNDAADYQPSDGEGQGGKALDRASNEAVSPFEKAKTYYFAQGRKSGRRDQREGVDYYATPEPIGLKMVEFAGIRPGEKVLEPSAGHGAIARFFPEDSDRTLVEPSQYLSSMAALNSPGANVLQHRFEDLHITNKYDAIVMNPPFGAGGATAVEHIAKAARHLRNGGRIVALLPDGPAAEKRFEAFRDSEEAADIHLVGDVRLPDVTFERAGTKVRTRIVVLERIADSDLAARSQTRRMDLSGAETTAELFDRIENADMGRRLAAPEMQSAAPDAEAAPSQVTFRTADTKHSKTGDPLFVATLESRVDAGVFTALNAAAKKHGGWYSSFRGAGAVPGFQFKTAEARQAFVNENQAPRDEGTLAATPAIQGQPLFRAETPVNKFFGVMSQKQRAEITAGLQDLANRILGHRIKLDVVDRVTPENFDGKYDPNTKTVTVAIQSAADFVETLGHEALHALRDLGVFTNGEWALLKREAERVTWDGRPLMDVVREAYDGMYRRALDLTEAQHQEVIAEEAVAYMMGMHVAGAIERPNAKASGIIDKFMRFLQAMQNLVAGYGFRTSQGVIEDIIAGRMAGRRGTDGPGRGFKLLRRRDDDAVALAALPHNRNDDLFSTEEGPDGKPQTVLPGAERLTDAQLAQRKADEALKARKPQKSMDFGLFGDEPDQGSLFHLRMPPSPQNGPVTFDEPEDSAMAIWNSNKPLLARMKGATANVFLPVRRALQDKMADWARVERAIEERTGNPLNAAMRVYQTETLFAGRAGERIENLRLDVLEPLAEDMKKEGIDLDTLDDYLTARHAPERNAHVAKINTNMPDGGSGMTNAEAQAVMNNLTQSGKMPGLQRLAAKIDRMIAETRQTLLNGGIIDQNAYDQLSSYYQHYVPLRGDPDADEVGLLPSGSRYDTRARVTERALGRRSRSESPVAYAIAQAQQAIILAEKARVGRAVLRLARRFPNPNLWQVNQIVTKRVIDKATGLVTAKRDTQFKKLADNVLAVREGGNLYYVTLHHPGMAQAMKNMDGSSLNAVLRFFLSLQRYYAMMRTGLDPQFFIPNFIRDLSAAGIHISGDLGGRILKDTLKNVPKAMRGVFQGERGGRTSPWAKRYQEFALAGGKVGVFGLETIDTIKGGIERDIKLLGQGPVLTPYKAGRAIVRFIMDVNSAVENAVRLSLYAAMRDAGYSQDDAAYAAKEVTVNFNRNGNSSKYLNAAYVFFNASVQGTVRVFKALATTKAARRAAMGLLVAGIAQDFINAMVSGDDDDDGENEYDQIPEWIRERNYIIMLPWGDKGNRVTLPLPWVYNVFHYAGVSIGRAIRGKTASTEATVNVLSALLNAANPLQASSLTQMISPTLLDPIAELWANKDWKGDPIMPEENQFDTPKPDSQRAFSSVNPFYKAAAETMNSWTGGDEIRPGTVDVSPESLEYIGEFLGGGVAATANQMARTLSSIWTGEEMPAERIPFLRKVYGTTSSTQGRNEYYTIRDAVNLSVEQLKAGDSETKAMVRSEYAHDLKIAPVIKEVDKQLSALRKARNAAASLEERQKIQEQMDRLMAKARKIYRSLQKDAGP